MPKDGQKILEHLEEILNLLHSVFSGCDYHRKAILLEMEKLLLLIKLDFLNFESLCRKNEGKKIYTPKGFLRKDVDNKKRESQKEQFFRFVNKNGKVSSKEIYGMFSGVNKREIRRMVGELIKEGKITRSVHGNLAIFSVIRK